MRLAHIIHANQPMIFELLVAWCAPQSRDWLRIRSEVRATAREQREPMQGELRRVL